MRSSSFVPLVEPAATGSAFRPFLAPAQGAAPAPPTPAAESAPADDGNDGTRRAFQAGYELGREELRSQIESIGESFVKSLEALAEFRARRRDRYERELLELALGVAKKVVRQELQARPEIWLGMLRNAVRHTVDRERIVLRVPRELAAFLRASMPDLRSALEDVKEIEVVEDPGLPQGGCVIESRFGEVDIGVETQLEAAEHALVHAED